VRSAAKAEFLKALPGAERLTIFDGVDLLTAEAFEGAMAGCEAVLHTASPFFFNGGTENSLVVPAVTGTRNVLDSCRKLGVRRVVLTASTACVYVDYGTVADDHVYTDKDWSPEPLLRQKANWYALSKTTAEHLAWELSREEGCPYELSVMNPTLIFGPQLPGQPHLNTSSSAVVAYIDGSMPEVPNACKAIVDVRDVAEAHVAAMERAGAAGQRFLLIGATPHSSDIAAAARAALPEEMRGNVPSAVSATLPAQVMGPRSPLPVLYDATPSERILGITYKSVQDMVGDAVRSLLENGFNSNDMYSIHKL
jgi:cinnamoyl-CoA reductase